MKRPLVRLIWHRERPSQEAGPARETLEAREPTAAEVAEHAALLRNWYNAPQNATMMGGSGTMTESDVVEFWDELRQGGGLGFLAFAGGALVGDLDLRNVTAEAAEFAIMIGDAARKGEGLGTAFALMLHVYAFRDLGMKRLYVPPKRANARVHGLNRRLGYVRDASAEAQAYADEPECVVSSLERGAFERRHAQAWREVAASRSAP